MQEMQSRVFFARTIGPSCWEGAWQELKNSDQKGNMGKYQNQKQKEPKCRRWI